MAAFHSIIMMDMQHDEPTTMQWWGQRSLITVYQKTAFHFLVMVFQRYRSHYLSVIHIHLNAYIWLHDNPKFSDPINLHHCQLGPSYNLQVISVTLRKCSLIHEIIASNSSNLLGKDWFQHLLLNWQEIHSLCSWMLHLKASKAFMKILGALKG